MTTPEQPRAFEEALQAHQTLVEQESVGRTALVASLSRLEETGSADLMNGDLTILPFAEAMHTAYSGVEPLTVRPPLNADMVTKFRGKAAMFGAVASQAVMTEDGSESGKPTDTSTIETDKPKPPSGSRTSTPKKK